MTEMYPILGYLITFLSAGGTVEVIHWLINKKENAIKIDKEQADNAISLKNQFEESFEFMERRYKESTTLADKLIQRIRESEEEILSLKLELKTTQYHLGIEKDKNEELTARYEASTEFANNFIDHIKQVEEEIESMKIALKEYEQTNIEMP